VLGANLPGGAVQRDLTRRETDMTKSEQERKVEELAEELTRSVLANPATMAAVWGWVIVNSIEGDPAYDQAKKTLKQACVMISRTRSLEDADLIRAIMSGICLRAAEVIADLGDDVVKDFYHTAVVRAIL
jgi:hypothetical protein